MKVGSLVSWVRSAPLGTPERVTGTVVAIVPAGRRPDERFLGRHGLAGLRLRIGNAEVARESESYLVEVGGAIHWPQVGRLREVKAS